MPVDYSKWDALELSDDSDIEVHPNVDKKSFIRAKQAQIHQNRAQRRHNISTLKYERIINDGLLLRIDRLLTALKSHRDNTGANPEQLVFQSLIESAGDPAEDEPPPPPTGVHAHVDQGNNRYSKMMAGLIDQVKQEIEKAGDSGSRLEAYISGVEGHKNKVNGLQKELSAKLAELEKEEARFITSDNIHTGFDYSNVAKNQAAPATTSSTKPSASVELLNPGPASRPSPERTDTGQSAGADADIEDVADVEGADDDEETPRADKLGKQFAKIALGDYRASLQFISANPRVLTEKNSDGLLVEAFEAQEKDQEKYAKQCVHQALLIQYCRQLGKDGVGLFFKRITTKDHQANKLFVDDVNSTYAKIKERVAVLAEQRQNENESGDVEQIQLHAVDPNTQITITVPPPVPDTIDFTQPGAPPPPPDLAQQMMARQIFESFPPGLQRALESGKLDEVNRVLGKMSVSEAEEVVEKLSQGGMLNLEEGVVDATTEEGKAMVAEIERTGRLPGMMAGEPGPEEILDVDDGDPPLE